MDLVQILRGFGKAFRPAAGLQTVEEELHIRHTQVAERAVESVAADNDFDSTHQFGWGQKLHFLEQDFVEEDIQNLGTEPVEAFVRKEVAKELHMAVVHKAVEELVRRVVAHKVVETVARKKAVDRKVEALPVFRRKEDIQVEFEEPLRVVVSVDPLAGVGSKTSHSEEN